MRILQLVPGTGAFYCGTCLRDHALARALKAAGHSVTIAPLYLPLVLEQPDDLSEPRVFYGGVNVFLEQHMALFRHAPHALRRLLDARPLLKWLAHRSGSTRPTDLGEITVSMLRGEEGRQRGELDRLAMWLQRQPKPDVILLATGLLAGMASRLRDVTGAVVVCTLQGEDAFLDALRPPYRERAWRTLAERACDIDLFVPVSHYYGDRMAARLHLASTQMRVIHNGIELEDLVPPAAPAAPPVLGYLAHMAHGKGLHTLVDAFIALRRRSDYGGLQLHVAGAATRRDHSFVLGLRRRLKNAGLDGETRFLPNIDRTAKIRFLQSLTLFSVPATYGEAFGLYVLEALACGVPVVQPEHGAFPEVLAMTGGGVLCPPDDADALADVLGRTLDDLPSARAGALAAGDVVRRHFTSQRMADEVVSACRALVAG